MVGKLTREVIKVTDEYRIVKAFGGNNGKPNWDQYFAQLIILIEDFKEEYNTDHIVLEKIDTDMTDDVFYATFYIHNN